MEVTWDEAKNLANKKKHGISFEQARELFISGVDYLEIFDDAHSETEDRFIAIGPITGGVVLVVSTEQDAGKSPHSAAVFSGKLNMKARRQEDFPEILLPVFPPSCEFSKNLRGCLRTG